MARANVTAQRRREIVDATVRVMAARGWNETSIDEITKEAGISRGLVSYHFKDKNELLSGVLERAREIFTETVREAIASASEPAEQMAFATRAAILQARDNPLPFEVFLHFSASARADAVLAEQVRDLYGHFRGVTAEGIRRGQACGVFRPATDPEAAAAKHQGTIIGIALQWLLDPGSFDLEATGELAIEMLMRSLRCPD